jgi:hypothetical protein
MRKLVRAEAGAGIFDKQETEPEPHKNGPAPQHWQQHPQQFCYSFVYVLNYRYFLSSVLTSLQLCCLLLIHLP